MKSDQTNCEMNQKTKYYNDARRNSSFQIYQSHQQMSKQDRQLIYNYQLLSLRGGGCGATKQKTKHETIRRPLPKNFCGDLEQYLNIVTEKCHLANDEQQQEEILLALQWLTLMKEHFNTLCLDPALFYDVIFKSVPNLLQSCITYLRISGYLCLQVLYVINDLMRVLFSFFITNKKRFLKEEEKQSWMDLILEVEVQIELSDNKACEFEILMIKAVIQSAPSNSNEGQQLLIDFMGGMVKSFLTFSLTDEFLDTLVSGAIFLFKAYKTQTLKQKYEIYYYFETLKWQVINCLWNGYPVKKILLLLSQAYEKYIDSSTDWIINSSWVKLIGFLLQYRPIISKESLSDDKPSQRLIWEQLIKSKIIAPLSVDKSMCRLLLVDNIDQLQSCQTEIKLIMKQYQIFHSSLLSLLSNLNSKIFCLKLNNQSQMQHINYLQIIFSENVNEWQEFDEEKQHIEVFKNQIDLQKKQYTDLQKVNKQDHKAVKSISKDFTDSLNNFIQRIQNSQTWMSSITFKIQLHLEKLKLITEAIKTDENSQNLKSLLSQKIKELEQNYEKFKQSQNLDFKTLVGERIKITYFLKKSLYTSQVIEIEGHYKNVEQFFSNLLSFKKQYHDFLETVKTLKMIYDKNIKKETVLQFQLPPLTHAYDLLVLILEQLEFQKIQEVYQNLIQTLNVSDDQIQISLTDNLIQIKFLEQLVQDYQNLLFVKKQMLEQLNNFRENYMTSLQSIKTKQEENQSPGEIIDKLNEQQFEQIKQLFSDLNGEDSNYPLKIADVLIKLKQDETILKSLATKDPSILELQKKSLFQTKMALGLLQQGSTIEELLSLQPQILMIYENGIKRISQVEQIQEKIQISFDEDNKFQKCLTSILDAINQSIDECKRLSQGLSTLLEIFQKTWKLSLTLETRIDLIKAITEEALKKLQQQFTVFLEKGQELSIKLRQVKSDAQPSNVQVEIQKSNQSQKFIELFLILYDSIIPQQEKKSDGSLITKAKAKILETYQGSLDYLHNYFYKVKSIYVVILITIQSSQLEQNITLYCQNNIVQVWATEKDQRVKAILKDKDMIAMQKRLFSGDLQTFQQKFQLELKEKLSQINDLEQRVNLEGNIQLRQQLQNQLQQEHIEFEEYLDNISDMSSQLEITLQFLKEIRKDLKEIKGKIDKLQDTMNQIGDDVRKLRGKTFLELFEYRKQKILDQKSAKNLTQIYIQATVQEWDPYTGKKIQSEGKQESKLIVDMFEDQIGELNEFLQNDLKTKDVMLIKGCAGSGKSRAAYKIEEFLWENRELKKSNWIPIYVSLPTLKEPKFNLLDEALMQELQFDKIQIREFKEALTKGELQIILILDSYDEMRQDCIQSNLIQTNRLLDLLQQCKVILTTRSEILTSSSYQTWFYGKSLQSLKEIELVGFSEEEQNEYLKQYSFMSVKKEIYDLYEFVKKVTQEKIDIEEFKLVWMKVENFLKKREQQKSDFVVNEEESQKIIEILKKEKCFKNIGNDQCVNLLKRLISLWSYEKFKDLIEKIKISNILTTPFMMEIVVQVLPSMVKKYTDPSLFRNQFIESFIKNKSDDIISENLIQKYKKIQSGDYQENDDEQIQISKDTFLQQAQNIWEKLLQMKFFADDKLMKKIDSSSLQNIEDTNIVIRALKINAFTVYEFYNSFIEFYHQWQMKKLKDLGKIFNVDGLAIDLFNYSQSLAIELTKKELTQVKYNAKGKLKLSNIKKLPMDEDWKDAYFNDFGEDGEYTKLIRSCTLLSQKGSIYSFSHKSIQEFYVAQYLITFLNQLPLMDDANLFIKKYRGKSNVFSNQASSTQEIQFQEYLKNISSEIFNSEGFNISTNNFKGVMQLIKKQIKNEVKDQLIQLVQFSQISTDIIRASSNSLYLLSFLQYNLAYVDFSNIQICDTKMNGLSFYKSSFQSSKFTNVSISSCNFNAANLQNVEWKPVYCNELPKITNWNNQQLRDVSQILFLEDENTILTHSSDQRTLFFDYKLGSCQMNLDLPEKFQDQKSRIALHPSGQFVALAVSNVIFQWHLNEKDKMSKLNVTYLEYINDICYSQDGKYLACAGKQRMVILNFQSILTLDNVKFCPLQAAQRECFQKEFFQIRFSQDGQMILASTSQGIEFWRFLVDDYSLTYFILNEAYSEYYPNFHLNGNILALYNYESDIEFYDLGTENYNLTKSQFEKDYQIVCGTFNQDGSLFVSGHKDMTLILWEVKSKKQLTSLQGTDITTSLSFSKNSQILACGGLKQGIRFWDIQASREMIHLSGHGDSVNEIAFSPDGQYLASCSYQIGLWDARKGRLIDVLDGHDEFINSIAFSPDGRTLASGSQDGKMILWNVSQREIQSINQNEVPVQIIRFSLDGKLLASCLYNSEIQIWEVQGQEIKLKNTWNLGNQFMYDFAFIPNFPYIVSLGSQAIQFWNIQLEGQKQYFELMILDVQNSMALSSNGSMLAISLRNDVGVFNIKDLKEDREEGELNQDGNYQRLLMQFQHSQKVTSVCFSKNSQLLVSGCSDKIWIWNIEQKQSMATLQGHQGEIKSIVFFLDDSILAFSSSNGQIRLCDMKNKQNNQIKPICFKIMAQKQDLQADDCQIYKSTIISQQGFDLERLLIQKGAIANG